MRTAPSWLRLLAVLLLAQLAVGEDAVRDPTWAVAATADGLRNLYKVSETLYRSAQPDDGGLKSAKALGIVTVINLRAFHNDRHEAEENGLLDEELSVKTWHIEDEDVVRVMKILAKADGGPYLVHCQHGADRTGLMVAMYRIINQGWAKDKAIDEMRHGGYGFHETWQNIIDYLKGVDVTKLKAEMAKAP